jgi:ankyrin repeat protein
MPHSSRAAPSNQPFLDLVHAIISGNARKAASLLDASPALLHEQAAVGATRNGAQSHFFEPIVQTLIDKGADCSARNRRGAQPLHYAADSNVWSPNAQAATIDRLIRAGADPNATDKSGVTPLHRAVRTRCAAAVEALLAGGAEPRGGNKRGSTPLHLAVQNTGRGNSGTPHAREQQQQIIELLLGAGAKPDDKDEKGKNVRDAANADWIRALLQR